MVCFSWVIYTLQNRCCMVFKVPSVWWRFFSLFSTHPILIWGNALQAAKSLAALRSSVSLACILLHAEQRQFQASSQVALGKDAYAANNLFLEDCSLGFFKHAAILPWWTDMHQQQTRHCEHFRGRAKQAQDYVSTDVLNIFASWLCSQD